MKKIIVKGIILILFGFFIGNYIFGTKIEPIKRIKNKQKYYFLQEGVYSNEQLVKDNLKDITKKVVEQKDNKYYVYLAITKDLEVINKIKEIYEKKGIEVYQKEKNINSEEFSNNVTQFDLLIKSTDDEDEILTIEEVVLANYDEITKKE